MSKNDDTISRQEAIDAIDVKNVNKGIISALQSIIEELPPAQQWIPVSEGLPKKPNENCDYYFSAIRSEDVKAEEYIVMIDEAIVPTTLCWDGEYWFDSPGRCEIPYKVKAWMELPEPYRGDADE